MCGIVGVLSSRPVDPKLVVRMRDTLTHRGPDAAGLWASDDGTVVLGHRRLAIIDLSPEANQPFVSADGRWVLVYNGEIYNYRALRRELEAAGVRFRTGSDTEVVLEAVRAWGTDALERFAGMFAFALWDTRERSLLCARDRVGEKPFYYARYRDRFVFGSELKALAVDPEFRRELSGEALADYLTFGFVPDPKAIWRDAAKLPPGHWLRVSLAPGEPPRVESPREYWDLRFAPDAAVDDWGEIIRGTLRDVADQMTMSDVPLGAFLSGGVDSSSVTAVLRQQGREVRSFTIGFADPDYDERPWARIVAERYGTDHTERLVAADDVDEVIPLLVRQYDEPFNDYSYLPTYYLCREARSQITVALSGDGGDELFAGYGKYQRLGRREQVERWISPLVARGLAGVAAAVAPHHGQRRFRHYAAAPRDVLADMLMLGFVPEELGTAARGDLAQTLAAYDPREQVLRTLDHAPPDDVGLVNAMRYLDLKYTLAGDILVKVDRASMAVSLEVRPVYLHADMLALAERIPASRLAGPNHAKGVLKTALEPLLPSELLFRRKQGFAMPLGRWMSNGGPLTDHTPEHIAPCVDPALYGRLLSRHRSGGADCTARLHALYFLDRWLATWL